MLCQCCYQSISLRLDLSNDTLGIFDGVGIGDGEDILESDTIALTIERESSVRALDIEEGIECIGDIVYWG